MNENGYIIIEGNIGVGKSTFSRIIAEEFKKTGVRAEYLPEPDEKNNPFLADYYKDPAAHAYEMQQHLLHRRFDATEYAASGALSGHGWFVLDRSYYGDICFARVQVQDGYFTDAQYESYWQSHKSMRRFIEPPSAAIFLKASTETCNRRIKERARDCEAGIAPAYLESLQAQIDRLELAMARRTRVIHLDWNIDRDEEDLRGEARLIVSRLLNMQTDYWDF